MIERKRRKISQWEQTCRINPPFRGEKCRPSALFHWFFVTIQKYKMIRRFAAKNTEELCMLYVPKVQLIHFLLPWLVIKSNIGDLLQFFRQFSIFALLWVCCRWGLPDTLARFLMNLESPRHVEPPRHRWNTLEKRGNLHVLECGYHVGSWDQRFTSFLTIKSYDQYWWATTTDSRSVNFLRHLICSIEKPTEIFACGLGLSQRR